MIKFCGNITDFWSEDLKNYSFLNRSNAGQRDYFHPNYSKESNELLQGFDGDLPECCTKFYSALDLSIGSVSWTCIEPGQAIPVHTDGFYKLRTQYNVNIKDCVRYLIFLQEWTLGHLVDFQEQIITRWSKGDVWMFDHESEHCAANASNVNFITCQVNTIK